MTLPTTHYPFQILKPLKRGGWGQGGVRDMLVSPPQKETTELMISTNAIEASGLGKNHITLLNFSNSIVECILAQSHETMQLASLVNLKMFVVLNLA